METYNGFLVIEVGDGAPIVFHVGDVFVDFLHQNAQRLAVVGDFAVTTEVPQLERMKYVY